MKVVFFGSGGFAVPILRAIRASGHALVAIVTQPDRRKGRHLRLAATPVKEAAQGWGLDIFQPADINTPGLSDTLTRAGADVFVVVSYGCILPEALLKIPNKMCVNIHASFLPAYRGAAPVQRALMAGERTTGVTFIRMNEYMDRGDILFKKKIRVALVDDALTLDAKLARLAAASVVQVLTKIGRGTLRPVKQDERKATYAPKLKKEEGRVRWSDNVREILDRYRGCFGWPGSFTTFQERRLNINEIRRGRGGRLGAPGQIIEASAHRFEVACGAGSVLIGVVTPESLPRMSARSFITAQHVETDMFLGAA